eukprot:s3782_g9.t1
MESLGTSTLPYGKGKVLTSFNAKSSRDTALGRVAELPNRDVTSWPNVLQYPNARIVAGFQSLMAREAVVMNEEVSSRRRPPIGSAARKVPSPPSPHIPSVIAAMPRTPATPAKRKPKAEDVTPVKGKKPQSTQCQRPGVSEGCEKKSKVELVKATLVNPKKRTKETMEAPVTQATPQKVARQISEVQGGGPPKTRKTGKGKEEKPSEHQQGKPEKREQSPPEGSESWKDWEGLMLKLFDRIETALLQNSSRYRITSVETLRQSVEASMNRDLTLERLRQVLSLSDGMLEALWKGEGCPYLSVEQRDKEGKPTRPEASELSERRATFHKALSGACARKEVPPKPLPPRPAGHESEQIEEPVAVDVEAGRAAAAKLAELAKLPSLRTTGTSKQRMEALKARIAAKKAIVAKEEQEEAEFQRLLDSISVCEDVRAAREVLVHMFARPGEGKIVNVSEKKILGALCSCTFADQCTRMVSLDAGKVALAKLKELGEGIWFSVIPAQYSQDTFWRRIPGGNDTRVRAALNGEMRALQEEKRKLVSLGSVKAAKVKSDK